MTKEILGSGMDALSCNARSNICWYSGLWCFGKRKYSFWGDVCVVMVLAYRWNLSKFSLLARAMVGLSRTALSCLQVEGKDFGLYVD